MSALVRCGTAAGGFRCAIVRRIVRPFMSWSDMAPAPTVASTPSYLAPRLRSAPAWTSLAGGDYLIHIKSEGRFSARRLMREGYSRDEIISRWVLTVISPQPI